MDSKEAISKLYDWWKMIKNISYSESETINDSFTEEEIKLIFLSDAIVGITTYDDDLSKDFGKIILEVLTNIQNKTTFEYIKNENNYKNYIIVCHFIESWIDWGTSIRGAWFEGMISPDEALRNIGYEKEHIDITKEFMDWFINFLKNKGV